MIIALPQNIATAMQLQQNRLTIPRRIDQFFRFNALEQAMTRLALLQLQRPAKNLHQQVKPQLFVSHTLHISPLAYQLSPIVNTAAYFPAQSARDGEIIAALKERTS